MTVRVAINGFGRIGRLVLRAAYDRDLDDLENVVGQFRGELNEVVEARDFVRHSIAHLATAIRGTKETERGTKETEYVKNHKLSRTLKLLKRALRRLNRIISRRYRAVSNFAWVVFRIITHYPRSVLSDDELRTKDWCCCNNSLPRRTNSSWVTSTGSIANRRELSLSQKLRSWSKKSSHSENGYETYGLSYLVRQLS